MTYNQLKDINDLPTPKGNFLLGHVLQFKPATQHEVVERWIEECGELFKINFLGQKLIVSANPAINNEIFKRRPDSFKRMTVVNDVLLEMGVDGVFNAEGDTWKRHRKPVSNALNNKRIKEYYPVFRDKVQNLIHKLGDNAENKKTTNITDELLLLAMDMTRVIAFGLDSDTISERKDDFQKHLEIVFAMLHYRMTMPIPIWRYIKRKKDREFEKSLKVVEKTIHNIINETKEKLRKDPSLKDKPSNFLETLLADDKANFTDDEIYGNVFTMLLAGEDTTSNTASWAMCYLSQNPDIIEKVREEANKVYPEDEVPQTKEQLSQLVYASAVVQEAIRYKPTIPQQFLESTKEVVIEHLKIPANTAIIVQIRSAQLDKAYFTDADKFIPDRWLKAATDCPVFKNHRPEMIKAFGGGTRLCPGKNLSMDENITLISSICKNFDFNLAIQVEDIKQKFTLTLAAENLLMQLKSIKANRPNTSSGI